MSVSEPKMYGSVMLAELLALEPHLSRHRAAMTTEGLHGKAEIAEELAKRDKTIAELRARIVELETDHGRLTRCNDCGCEIMVSAAFCQRCSGVEATDA